MITLILLNILDEAFHYDSYFFFPKILLTNIFYEFSMHILPAINTFVSVFLSWSSQIAYSSAIIY